MRRKTLHALSVVTLCLGTLFALISTSPAQGSTMRADTRTTILAASDRTAATRISKRLRALAWAKKQEGKPYIWGGTGPDGFDCSGLVYAAYLHAGVNFGEHRTTYDLLSWGRLVRTTHPQPGDLAFFGSGHVELYISGTLTHGTTFGAHHSGTTIGYRSYSSYYHPSVFVHVNGAG